MVYARVFDLLRRAAATHAGRAKLIKSETRNPKQIPSDEIEMTETETFMQARRLNDRAGAEVMRLRYLSFVS
jgi:hypothetical protein